MADIKGHMTEDDVKYTAVNVYKMTRDLITPYMTALLNHISVITSSNTRATTNGNLNIPNAQLNTKKDSCST